jgi:hypothetical protein
MPQDSPDYHVRHSQAIQVTPKTPTGSMPAVPAPPDVAGGKTRSCHGRDADRQPVLQRGWKQKWLIETARSKAFIHDAIIRTTAYYSTKICRESNLSPTASPLVSKMGTSPNTPSKPELNLAASRVPQSRGSGWRRGRKSSVFARSASESRGPKVSLQARGRARIERACPATKDSSHRR